MKILKRLLNHWPLLILIPLFTFLIFYRINWLTLANWDEAWYGGIAQSILKSQDWLKMSWNGNPFYFHPPLGIWMIAISYKIFGISEFSTRLPSAIMGLGSIILIYLSTKNLFQKKEIGFVASLILGTSVWYLIRMRSGDLDSTLIFFYLLTLYCSIKSSKKFIWFLGTMIAFGALLLSKTLVGVSAIIPIVLLNYKSIINIKKNYKILIGGVVGLLIVVLPWYLTQIITYPSFIREHFVNVGLRGKDLGSYFHLELTLPLFYLHMGVRKWYYLWIASIGLIFISWKFIKQEFFTLLSWNIVILYPFLTTNQTHIWHLIPVYIPIAIITSAGIYYGGLKLLELLKLKDKLKNIINITYVLFFLCLSMIQIKNFYKEVYPSSMFTPDDVDISQKVAKYNRPIFLDDSFKPVAIFYSGHNVIWMMDLPEEKRTAQGLFNSDEKDFVMITRNNIVDELKKTGTELKVLEKNKYLSIISR